MEFKDKINEYIKILDCSAKDLAESSNLSAATISRYRSGERIPVADTQNFTYLIEGIVKIAKNKGISGITKESVNVSLSKLAKDNNINATRLQDNFSTLLTVLPISISEISKFLNYDSSYISRIRNGQRQPSNLQDFALGIANFVGRRYKDESEKEIVAH